MNYYEDLIIKATGCIKDDAAEIEDIMRNTILHSTLDWLNTRQFNKAAREAKEVFDIWQDPAKLLPMLDDVTYECLEGALNPVVLKNPQAGEERYVYRIVNYNKVTNRCYIKLVNPEMAIPPQELVSVNDIFFVKQSKTVLV